MCRISVFPLARLRTSYGAIQLALQLPQQGGGFFTGKPFQDGQGLPGRRSGLALLAALLRFAFAKACTRLTVTARGEETHNQVAARCRTGGPGSASLQPVRQCTLTQAERFAPGALVDVALHGTGSITPGNHQTKSPMRQAIGMNMQGEARTLHHDPMLQARGEFSRPGQTQGFGIVEQG